MSYAIGDEYTFHRLQQETAEWRDKNFPGYTPEDQLLGAIEELGELAHAHLKAKQGIRGNENLQHQAEDAVGDLIIYLAGYCSAAGLELQEVVEVTWQHVRKRNWIEDPERGGE